MDYCNWLGDNWARNLETPMPSKGMGGFAKWGNQNPMCRSPRADPGGKVYHGSDWALKTKGRSLAKIMPLLSEFTFYVDWETDVARWAKMLYIRPISQRVDYFPNNLEGNKSSLADKSAGGVLKHKSKSKVAEMKTRPYRVKSSGR